MNKITFCIISRNEEENIERCLKSIKDVADEIIVVDTGSVDHTVDIALKYGAKVIEDEWKDDFSFHRNKSIENATGDWIFFIDCDEELDENSKDTLIKVINDEKYIAYSIYVKNVMGYYKDLTFTSIRLFKNDKDLRFRGRIHEQIVYSILEKYGRERIGNANIYLLHYGYNPEVVNVRPKVKRNFEILKKYTEEEKDGFYYYNLGTEYLRIGEFKEALKNYLKSLELTNPASGYGPILVKKTITLLIQEGRYKEAYEQLKYYKELYKDYKDLIFLEYLCLYNSGFYSKAYEVVKRYKEMPESPAFYPTEEYINNENFHSICLELKKNMIQNSNKITVCVIAGDEQEKIARAIKSVNEFAEEVLVFSKNDNTLRYASRYFAKVYKKEFDDFIGLFDFLVENALGDWILFLYADEVIKINGLINLEEKYNAYEVEIVNVFENEYYATKSLRLLRKEWISVENFFVSNKNDFKKLPAQIFHYHLPNESRLNIILKTLDKLDTLDVRYREFLKGKYYFEEGEFAKAVDSFEKCLHLNFINEEICYYYSMSLLNLRRFNEVINFLEDSVNLFNDYTELFYLLGISYYAVKDIERAKSFFERCIALGESKNKKVISKGVGSFKALKSLAVLFYINGEYDKAMDINCKLLNYNEGYDEAIEGITHILMKENKIDKVESFLKEIGQLNFKSLLIVAKILIKMSQYERGLKYILKAAENKGCSPEIMETFDFLINNIIMRKK